MAFLTEVSWRDTEITISLKSWDRLPEFWQSINFKEKKYSQTGLASPIPFGKC